MKGLHWMALALLALLVARPVSAQSTAGIVGVVRDTTGAVLPGVTVEAASPALIEKVRTAVTDGQGRFNITNLRPGIYEVTFTLPGFSTFKRDGVELSAGFTATANADMKVGGLEETVTVTGASPVVDIQNVRTQQVLKQDVLDALPSGQRDITALGALTLGAVPTINDVGGARGESAAAIMIHGGRGQDGRMNYDGMNTNHFFGNGGGMMRIWKFNTVGVQETVIDTGGAGAETETGGANINMVPRDGGNQFSLHTVNNYTNKSLSSGKVSDDLIARGSAPQSKSMKQVWDYGVGVGGRIIRDRLWFYGAGRFWGGQTFGANNYFNKSPVFYRYEADLSRPAYTDGWQRDVGGRFTLQATQKQKFTSSLNWQRACGCWLGIGGGAATSPEASTSFQYGKGHGMWLSQNTWNYPATNRLLFQIGASFLIQAVTYDNDKFPGANDISIVEQTTGYRWGTQPGGTDNAFQPHKSNNFTQRATISYVTGSHAVKAGLQALQGRFDPLGNALPNGLNYTFSGGVPLSITQFASPFENHVRVRNLGLYAQDQWTISRLTINAGVRYDHFSAYSLAFTVPAGPYKAERAVPAAKDLPNFHDITPRLGMSYDVFGNGKTALKASWGRYLMGQGAGDARSLSPAETIFLSTTRPWNDSFFPVGDPRRGNFVPDCILTDLLQNAECGTAANLAFGQPNTVLTWDESSRTGWGVREYNHAYSATLQHELRTGLGVSVSFNRTDWRNQQAVVNQAVAVSDYTSYCITAPVDPRLGAISGQQVCGLYDISIARLGQQNNHRMLAKNVPGAEGVPKEIFNGVDVAFNARFANQAFVSGGVTLGRTTLDYCWQNRLPNVTQNGTPGSLPRTDEFCTLQASLWNGIGSQVKLQAVYPLPGKFVLSGTYKNVPGIPVSALYTITNAQASASLGRDLAVCRGAVPCVQTATAQLLPVASSDGNASAMKYDQRINQIDLSFTRGFRAGKLQIRPIAELYNVLNQRPVQGIRTVYGSTWLLPSALLGGRLFKFGAQVDF